MNLSKRLKDARTAKGFSQKQLAEHLGFTAYTTYQKYELGAREPDLEKLVAIAKYLDVSVDYLLGLTDDSRRSRLVKFSCKLPRDDQGAVEPTFVCAKYFSDGEPMNFSPRLKELRLKKGVSQAVIAETIGISVTQYQNYEYGKKEPTLKNLLALADFFGVSLDYLVGRVN